MILPTTSYLKTKSIPNEMVNWNWKTRMMLNPHYFKVRYEHFLSLLLSLALPKISKKTPTSKGNMMITKHMLKLAKKYPP